MSVDTVSRTSTFTRILKAAFFPVVFLYILIFHFVDKRIFGGKFERRDSERLRESFAVEIQERVPTLFAGFGGQIIPNMEDYPPAFDYAAVTVSVDGMLLLFTRCRGDFQVDITPVDKPSAWREIAGVVKNSTFGLKPNPKTDYYGLNDFGRFFGANFDILRHEVDKPDWRPPGVWLRPV
jgi:hypothetical protein